MRLPFIIMGGVAALFLMSLVVIPVFFGANQLFQGVGGGHGDCTDTSNASKQPNQSASAADIPADYLAFYKKAGAAYGIPWNVLAGIGEVETNHGRSNLPGVHSGTNFAGAAGPMQFEAATWAIYGVDGDGDGKKDIYDPADAIFSAANYLKHSGAPNQMNSAIFTYNHSSSYVSLVLQYAQQYSSGGFQVVQANMPSCADMNGAPTAPNAIVAAAIAYAKAQIGKPYIFGGVGPTGYDCSGLMMMAYKAAGVTIPRLSDAQYWWGPHVPNGQEQPGDLVFFDFKPGHSGPGHVGMVYDPARHIMIVARHEGTLLTMQNYQEVGAAEGLVGFTRPASHKGAANNT